MRFGWWLVGVLRMVGGYKGLLSGFMVNVEMRFNCGICEVC